MKPSNAWSTDRARGIGQQRRAKHGFTSYMERKNLYIRMGLRRFNRLTTAFSKRTENDEFISALFYIAAIAMISFFQWPPLLLIVLIGIGSFMLFDLVRQPGKRWVKVLWGVLSIYSLAICVNSFVFYTALPMLNRILLETSAILLTAVVLFILKRRKLIVYAVLEIVIGVCTRHCRLLVNLARRLR